MKFQYASDLHLEFYQQMTNFSTILEPVAPVLVLAGDIGYPWQTITVRFLGWCAAHWKHVIWVYGNHEYFNYRQSTKWKYGGTVYTMEECDNWAATHMANLPNLHVLQGETLILPEYPDVLIYGGTLWSEISAEVHAAEVGSMADFRLIAMGRNEAGDPVPISLERRVELYRKDLAALEAAVSTATAAKQKLLVVTHHLPTYAMIQAKYRDTETNPYYANRLDHLLKKECLKAWICGHSHGRIIIEHPTYCGLNARGYPGEQKPENRYQRAAVVDLSVETRKAPAETAEEGPVEFV